MTQHEHEHIEQPRDGHTRAIVEMLSERNAILDDMEWLEERR